MTNSTPSHPTPPDSRSTRNKGVWGYRHTRLNRTDQKSPVRDSVDPVQSNSVPLDSLERSIDDSEPSQRSPPDTAVHSPSLPVRRGSFGRCLRSSCTVVSDPAYRGRLTEADTVRAASRSHLSKLDPVGGSRMFSSHRTSSSCRAGGESHRSARPISSNALVTRRSFRVRRATL